MNRRADIVLVTLGLVALARPARADDPQAQQAPPDRKLAIGVRAGIIPPILTAAEIVVRPRAKLALGLFGMYTTGAGIGNGGTRTSIGGHITYEFRVGRRETPYFSFAYDYYHASPDTNGFWETTQLAYLTGGYIGKWDWLEFFFGGGIVVEVAEDKPPCQICVNVGPGVLPTLELGVRFAFL